MRDSLTEVKERVFEGKTVRGTSGGIKGVRKH